MTHVRKTFDHEGRPTFVSYPAANAAAASGISTQYDALGRVTRLRQDSELGSLDTLTEYIAPFTRKVTDPRGNITRTTFQVFEEPSYETPLTIVRTGADGAAASAQTTTFVRNGLGRATSMRRTGLNPSVNVTRSYVYDANERLCARTEPEAGTTLYDYDLSGNLIWEGQGTASVCNRAQATNKISYSYDALNRLLSTNFADGTGAIARTWYRDGALKTISSGGTTWTYDYNGRRQLTREKLAAAGKSFVVDWAHDVNGSVSGMIYPDLTVVAFAPNALGQPTQVGSYATGIKHHPNGAVSEFYYGNGIKHTMTRNARQLPASSKDGGVVSLSYSYDGSGNVTDIVDSAQAGLDTRSMTYDAFDRLASVSSNQQRWGLATFQYDAVDNLRQSNVGGAQTNYSYQANRLISLSGAQSISYGYDLRGNATQRVDRGVTRSFTVDRANRVTSTSGQDGSESYLYDGLGRRVRITRAGGAQTWQVYSQAGQLLAEQAPDGKFTNFLYLNGSLIARTAGEPELPGVPNPPAAPTSPAVNTSGTYAVSWSLPSGVTHMVLLESKDGAPATPVTPQPPAGATQWTASARVSGVYRYSLRACGAGGCSKAGPASTTYVVRAPTGLTWTPQPLPVNTPYTVKWNAVSSATSYKLEARSGATWSVVYSGTAAQAAQGARGEGSYPYRVSACRGTTCSAPSAEVIVTIVDACSPSAPPSISVSPTSSTDGAFTVSWGASTASCVPSYQLEERFNQTQWQPLALSGEQNTQRRWSPSPPKDRSGTYSYRVRACGTASCSGYIVGATVTVTLPVSLAVPAALQVCRTGAGQQPCAGAGSTLELLGRGTVGYRVSWEPVANATSYQYQRKVSNGQNEQTEGWKTINAAFLEDGGNPAGEPGGWFQHAYVVRACAGNTCGGNTNPGVAVKIISGPLLQASATTTYIHTDLLGSPVAETDATGAVLKDRAYYPWGAPTNDEYEQGPGYTGHVTDALTRLSYMQQRFYDPEGGRFLSVDPVTVNTTDGSNFNRYAYANNNPYGNIDPDGRQAIDIKLEPPPTLPTVNVSARASSAPSQQASAAVTLGAVTVTASRALATNPASIVELGTVVVNGFRVGGPAALMLYSKPMGAAACEMPGAGPCGMGSKAFPSGYWPGDAGADEWGRRNGVGAKEGRGRMHGIKQKEKGQGGGRGTESYGVNPSTGDVVNPAGEVVGNLGEVKSK